MIYVFIKNKEQIKKTEFGTWGFIISRKAFRSTHTRCRLSEFNDSMRHFISSFVLLFLIKTIANKMVCVQVLV